MRILERKNILITMAALILLSVSYHLGPLRFLERYFNAVLDPVAVWLYRGSNSMRAVFGNRAGRGDLLAENLRLREDVKALLEENTRLKVVKEENNSLREHLGFISKNKPRYVLAQVMARSSESESGRARDLLIDQGRINGLTEGLAVISGNGTVVGKVAKVEESQARVVLVSNPACRFAAALLNESGTSGVAEGQMSLTIKLDYVPMSKSLSVGDLLVTSGLETGVPRGLLLGKVSEVKRDTNDVWQSAVIEPLADPDSLSIVSVILPAVPSL